VAGLDARAAAAPPVIWGKHDLSFELSEPEAYRRDVPSARVYVLDAGNFALDTAADQIAELVRVFQHIPLTGVPCHFAAVVSS